MELRKVGFIGLGTMGHPMALNLLKAGFSLKVYDIMPAAVQSLAESGASPAASARDAARDVQVVITMLPDSPHVEEAVAGADGILASLEPGTVVIDMSTISPTVAQSLAAKVAGRGAFFLDAPVSGGMKGAREGKLSIMAGGDEAAFERVRPVLSGMGTTLIYVGGSGMGQAVKACNQIICAMNIQAICEAFALGRAAGVDLTKLREVLLGGAASSWMLQNLGPQMIDGDASAGFRIDLQLKDLKLAQQAAFEWGVPLPGAALATNLYLEARAHGEGSNGNQAMFRVYDRMTNHEGRR